MLESRYLDQIEVVPVATLNDVLDNLILASPGKAGLLEKLAKFLPTPLPIPKATPGA